MKIEDVWPDIYARECKLHEEKKAECLRLDRMLRECEENRLNAVKRAASNYKDSMECTTLLAASQTENKVLRDALEFFIDTAICQADINVATEALAQPTDDRALKDALAADRERCAQAVIRTSVDDYGSLSYCASVIRALGDSDAN